MVVLMPLGVFNRTGRKNHNFFSYNIIQYEKKFLNLPMGI